MAFSMDSGGNDQVTSTINVVPLIDVLLVLLIIFMVTAPLMSHKVKVHLPKANVGKTDDKIPPAPPVTVAITENGQFYWNDQPMTKTLLESKLAVTAQQTPQPVLNLRGDATTKYRSIKEVVDMAQAQGMRQVAYIAEKQKH